MDESRIEEQVSNTTLSNSIYHHENDLNGRLFTLIRSDISSGRYITGIPVDNEHEDLYDN